MRFLAVWVDVLSHLRWLHWKRMSGISFLSTLFFLQKKHDLELAAGEYAQGFPSLVCITKGVTIAKKDWKCLCFGSMIDLCRYQSWHQTINRHKIRCGNDSCAVEGGSVAFF